MSEAKSNGDSAALVDGIVMRLRQWREQSDAAEACFNCGALSAFMDLLDDAEEMESMLVAWQNWWNEIGFRWYIEGSFLQADKPPFLRESSEHFQKWIKSA